VCPRGQEILEFAVQRTLLIFKIRISGFLYIPLITRRQMASRKSDIQDDLLLTPANPVHRELL